MWFNQFFYSFQKHYCPSCKKALKAIKISKIVCSALDEAKALDFSESDNYLIGNVRFIWTELKCEKCNNPTKSRKLKATKRFKN